MAATQILLQFPPGLKIHEPSSFVLTLKGGKDPLRGPAAASSPAITIAAQSQPSSSTASLSPLCPALPLACTIQPRIQNLHNTARMLSKPRRSYGIEDSSALRKKLGHAAVMVACARVRRDRRKAAIETAEFARMFNFTGEWEGGCLL
ncbi:hypothetical protein CPB86DRAFT_360375 [Serendipita vermifera]|nr:hypothetical protein CPB86DRAFT_360375 [Serendipita vermifera]